MEEKFCRRAVKGGRVCPRKFRLPEGEKGVYLDVSGMYSFIMHKHRFPYGKT